MPMSRGRLVFALMAALRAAVITLGCALAANAGEVSIKITDRSGTAVPNAVIALYAASPSTATPVAVTTKAVMDQRDRQFAPHVLAVQRGTSVRFPNSDDIRHQVYSFSDAKRFSLPLYHGIPAEPLLFDRAGEVALGCNIHDRMLGYIYVVDTPWFVRTEANGTANLSNVPAGIYVAKLWYPGLSTAGGVVVNPVLQIPVNGAATLLSNLAERESSPTPEPTATDSKAARSWGERRGNN